MRARKLKSQGFKFASLHKTTSYLMVAAALTPLVISPDITMVARILTVFALVLSWFADPKRFPIERFSRAWNILTIGFLVWVTIQIFRGESPVTAGVYFLLFVLINKLFNRRTSKDYQQAYIVSFLMMIAATAIETSIVYAVCFFFYILFATWALILFHLRRAIEQNYVVRHKQGKRSQPVDAERMMNSRRVIGLPFLAGTSLISMSVMLGAAAFFTFIPRIGFGLFGDLARNNVSMTGFNEEVELGQHGRIRDNHEVVMRVNFHSPTPEMPIRWRGTSLDHYQDGKWKQSEHLRRYRRRMLSDGGLFILQHAPGIPEDASSGWIRNNLLKHEIYLEPLGSDILFGADRPVAIEVPRAKITRKRSVHPRQGPLGEIRARKTLKAGVRYMAYSRLGIPPARVLRQAEPIDVPELRLFLQLPKNLPKRVYELANRLTKNRSTVFDKVVAVQRYVLENYAYTKDLTHDEQREPIDEFLFETREGHCEYFASAMSILLRAAGIHTRHVNGFSGGEWNEFGDYWAVKQSDAHSWTEVLFSNAGWVSFDPTPPAGQPQTLGAGLLRNLEDVVDALKMRWNVYVVEYDLTKQIAFFKQIGAFFGELNSGQSQESSEPVTIPKKEIAVGIMIVGALVIVVALWWHRRRAKQRGTGQKQQSVHWATLLYRKSLSQLSQAGHSRPMQMTPTEFAGHLTERAPSLGHPLSEMTNIYNRARFGGVLSTQERQHLTQLSDRLSQLITSQQQK